MSYPVFNSAMIKLDISNNKLTRGALKSGYNPGDEDYRYETDISGVLALSEAIKDS